MADPEVSPRLRAVLDSCMAGVKPEFYDLGTLSVWDSFGPSFGSWSEPENLSAHVVSQAQLIALQPSQHSSSASSSSSVSSASHSFAPGRSCSFEPVAFKPPRRVAPKPYEHSFAAEQRFGARSAEKATLDSWASEIFEQMGDSCKERFLHGRSSVPSGVHDGPVLESLKKTAQTDQLRSTVYALRRLDEWLSFRFSPLHGFDVPDVFIAWFLQDNLVDGDHASQSLVAGLRFAENALKFPFSVSSSSLRALSRAPTKTPKQAPSASVRVAYHFWEVASNEQYSIPLRGVSAIFLVKVLLSSK